MLCARVMRGISSIEKAATPFSASACEIEGSFSGSRKATRVWPWRRRARSARPASVAGGDSLTRSIRSARAATSTAVATISAPCAAYAASVKPAARPAPLSIATVSPAFTSAGITAGTTATRRSPGSVSAITPAIIAFSILACAGHRWRRVILHARNG